MGDDGNLPDERKAPFNTANWVSKAPTSLVGRFRYVEFERIAFPLVVHEAA
jgi:hypothetical protein